MLTVLIFFLIYLGVTISIWQVYNFHYNLNFRNQEIRSHIEESQLKDLSLKAKEYSETGTSSGFLQAVESVFGRDFDHRIVLAAFSRKDERAYVKPLLWRKNNIVCNGRIKILHLSFLKTSPPTIDIRGVLLITTIINSFLVLFLGGMSVYTIAYEVSVDHLSWFNDELVLMLAIYSVVAFTYLISRFDLYMHDIYQIGKLNNDLCEP